jgi:hypothetical protein
MEGNLTAIFVFGILIIGYLIMKKLVFRKWDEEIKCQMNKNQ